MRRITPRQEQNIRSMFSNVVHNLSYSENMNHEMDEQKAEYYKGICVTAIGGIQGYLNCNWLDSMRIFNSLLPLDHISLNLVLPESWRDVLDEYGRIELSKVTEQEL